MRLEREKEALEAVAAYNVRTLALKGEHRYGRDERVQAKGQQLGCNFIVACSNLGGPAARRSVRQSITFSVQARKKTAARQGLYAVGLAVKESLPWYT